MSVDMCASETTVNLMAQPSTSKSPQKKYVPKKQLRQKRVKTTIGNHRNQVRIAKCSKSVSKWLHPVFRVLVPRHRPFQRRRFVVRRNEATRIRNKTIYYNPIPRVFPYFCERCQTSSRFLSVLKEHSCTRRRAREYDPTNEQRIASMGYRCRAKDWMAVMERVPNPQHFKISSTIYVDIEKCTVYKTAKTLREICHDAIEDMLPTVTIGKDIEESKQCPPSERCMCTGCGLVYGTSTEFYSHLQQEPTCYVDGRPILL